MKVFFFMCNSIFTCVYRSSITIITTTITENIINNSCHCSISLASYITFRESVSLLSLFCEFQTFCCCSDIQIWFRVGKLVFFYFALVAFSCSSSSADLIFFSFCLHSVFIPMFDALHILLE